MSTTLDPRVDELVAATALATRVGEVVDLLVEARGRLIAAAALGARLPKGDVRSLDGRLDRDRLERFRHAIAQVDPANLGLDIAHMIDFRESLIDLASDVRQEMYDALARAHDAR
jgi:hypothetical protein